MPQGSSSSNIEELGKLFDDNLLKEVIANMIPESLLQWRLISKQYRDLVNDLLKNELLWRNKLILHFPLYSAENRLDAFTNFQNAYKGEYAKITPQQRALFSAAKEGVLDVEKIDTKSLLTIADCHGLTALDWLAIKKHQPLLNGIYEKFFKDFNVYQFDLSIINRANFGYPMAANWLAFRFGINDFQLLWAIKCQQPLQTIQQIATTCQLLPDLILILLYEATRLGNLSVVSYLYQFINSDFKNSDVFKMQLFSTIKEVAKLGHIEVVNFFLNLKFAEIVKPGEEQWFIVKVVEQAVCGGHLNIINCLRDQVTSTQLLEFATRYGRENLADALLKEQTFDQDTIISALIQAVTFGKLGIIKCICSLTSDNKPIEASLFTALNSCISHHEITPNTTNCIMDLIDQLDFKNKSLVNQKIEWMFSLLDKAVTFKKREVIEKIMSILFAANVTPGKILKEFNEIKKELVFAAICKNETEALLKVRSLLQLYLEGQFYQLKRSSFWNNDVNQQKVANIVKQIDAGIITKGEELMENLVEIKSNGLIYEIKKYIENEIYPHLAKSRKRKAQVEMESSLQEKHARNHF